MNRFTMALWGLIVAAVLAIGFLLLFVGLAVAVPVLAHSSWHLYRKVVEGRPSKRPTRAPDNQNLGILVRAEKTHHQREAA